jgi:phosphatidylserine/phosphatidylglycerophosphate/cardiolipin synthase-like enzyme/DNA/RNA endonuclease YhcR with UshA esterase domain
MKKYTILFLVFFLYVSNVFALTIMQIRKAGPGLVQTVNGTSLNGAEFGTLRYIWDGTGAVAVYGAQMSTVNKGDSISVTGTTVDYNGLMEITTITSSSVIATNHILPSPEIVEAYELAEYTESALVRLNKVTFINPIGVFASNNSYDVLSNGLPAVVYIKSGNSLIGQSVPSGIVSVQGICSQYNNTYQVLPRNTADIIAVPVYMVSSPSVLNLSSTGFQIAMTTNISANSFAKYGLTTDLELGNITGTNGGINHLMVFSGLQSAKRYFVKVFAVAGNDTIASAIKAFSTSSNSANGTIKVWFNRPVDHTKASPVNNLANQIPANKMADSIASLINQAQFTLDIAMYSFGTGSPQPIIAALNAAANRGVQIRYIYDYGMPNGAVASLVAGIKKVISPQPASTNEYNIMHNKFLVIDANAVNAQQAFVVTGSTNFTGGQLNDDANNVIIIRDQAVATTFKDEFDEMWGSVNNIADVNAANFGYFKRDNTAHEFVVGGKRVEIYFSPSDNTTENIRTTLLTANNDLYFANLIFTQQPLADAIVTRHAAGVFASGLINDTVYTDHTAFNNLKNSLGTWVQLYDWPNHAGILHHKYCIIDQVNPASDPAVISGSHNWTITAERQNDENLAIIHDAAIANQFYQEFVSRFNENGGALSVNEKDFNDGVRLWPNPATDKMSISFDEPLPQNTQLIITDMLGRYHTVSSITIGTSTDEISVGNLESGCYLMSITIGTKKIFRKFIKE